MKETRLEKKAKKMLAISLVVCYTLPRYGRCKHAQCARAQHAGEIESVHIAVATAAMQARTSETATPQKP